MTNTTCGRQKRRARLALQTLGLLAIAGVAYSSRERLREHLVDVVARRPGGTLGRLLYRNPRAHFQSFETTLAALDLRSDDRLLEVGCGGGTLLALALASGCEAKAVDHSRDMVVLASQRNATACRNGRLEVIHARAEELPFAAEQFTCAAMTNAFFFVQDPARALQELSRVLRPAGRLAIHTTAPDPPLRMAPPPIARRMRFYTDEQLHKMASTAGFVDISVARHDDGYSQLLTAIRP
jgi:ubiquinone/menaquinone biosynthesis C-methylase UbiE